MNEPTLPQRMRAYAAVHSLPPEHALMRACVELEHASTAERFDAKRVLAAWARARLIWRNITGERLV